MRSLSFARFKERISPLIFWISIVSSVFFPRSLATLRFVSLILQKNLPSFLLLLSFDIIIYILRSVSRARYKSSVPYPHSLFGYSINGLWFTPSSMMLLIWLEFTPRAPGSFCSHSVRSATAPAVMPADTLEPLLVTNCPFNPHL